MAYIECEGWRRHSSLIFLILLFTKPNIEVSGWLYQTKTHFTHIVYQPFSRVSPPSFTLYGNRVNKCKSYFLFIFLQTTCSNDISLLYPWMHISDTLLDIKCWLRKQTHRQNGDVPTPPPPLLAGSLGIK